MKIALYKNIRYDNQSVYAANGFFDDDDGYIRLSEIIDIDFKMLPYCVAAEKEIALIDKQINKELADHSVKISQLESRKSELLAIGVDDDNN